MYTPKSTFLGTILGTILGDVDVASDVHSNVIVIRIEGRACCWRNSSRFLGSCAGATDAIDALDALQGVAGLLLQILVGPLVLPDAVGPVASRLCDELLVELLEPAGGSGS